MAPHLISSSGSISVVQGVELGNTQTNTNSVFKTNTIQQNEPSTEPEKTTPKYKWEMAWRNVIAFLILHPTAFLGLYWVATGQVKVGTFVFTYCYGTIAGLGVTAGAHRLWAHRTYSAKLPLRIFFMLLQTIALQNDIYDWCRDHRVHHKFTDTDADPHNSSRGFFFSHMGWLMLRKHPQVTEKGKTVDLSDVLQDPVVRFQRKYYIPLIIFFNLVVPIYVVYYLIDEPMSTAVVATITRYTISLHITWLVNSAAHIWGMKPYDKNINPTENVYVSLLSMGEGWHNYHHVFPWDYRAAELGSYALNLSTLFLDFMAKIGQAYDMKKASDELIRKRVLRTGDQTWTPKTKAALETNGYTEYHLENQEPIWGWGDKDMKEDEVQYIIKSKRHAA